MMMMEKRSKTFDDRDSTDRSSHEFAVVGKT
jgi:hypothetical protein